MTDKRDLGTYRPVVTDEILIAEFRKNRAARTVRVMLRAHEGQNLIDIRTWLGGPNNSRTPGVGFSCSGRLLPELSAAIAKARAVAIDSLSNQMARRIIGENLTTLQRGA
jgi:hypothetical protein